MDVNSSLISTRARECYRFSSLCLLCILLSMVFNDLSTQNTLGTLGASPMWAVSIVIFVLILTRSQFRLYLDKYSRYFLSFYIATFLISIIQCIYYFFIKGEALNQYGVSVFNKHIFASSYYLFYFLVIYCSNFVMRTVSGSFLRKSIISISVLLSCVIAIESIAPELLSPFHLSMDGYIFGPRLRLLSPEPSIAAFTFNIFLLLAIMLSNLNPVRYLFWGLLLIGNILIGSKASLMLIMVSGILVFYFNMTLMQKLKSLIGLIPIIGLVIYIFIHNVMPALIVDIDRYTSVSTRLITSLWALCSLFYFPLGEGYGTYTVWFAQPLKMATNLANNLVSFPLNMSEINDMVSSGDYLSAKSGILFSVIHSGFLAIIFYYIIFRNSFRDVQVIDISYYQKTLLRVVLWYSLLSILLAVNMEVLYSFLLPFIVVNYLKSNS
ncbi:hypothetical protein STW0522KLE44_16630 [Klebsiella sp. STW0522-44]|nr:hypothetical protein STW0522KLE44_16630 [Klebsiella sp. STW0522-44]